MRLLLDLLHLLGDSSFPLSISVVCLLSFLWLLHRCCCCCSISFSLNVKLKEFYLESEPWTCFCLFAVLNLSALLPSNWNECNTCAGSHSYTLSCSIWCFYRWMQNPQNSASVAEENFCKWHKNDNFLEEEMSLSINIGKIIEEIERNLFYKKTLKWNPSPICVPLTWKILIWP